MNGPTLDIFWLKASQNSASGDALKLCWRVATRVSHWRVMVITHDERCERGPHVMTVNGDNVADAGGHGFDISRSVRM